MKKVLLLAIIATAFGMTSCKKDYTCTCTTTVYDTDVTPNTILTGPITTSTTIEDKKSDATTACEKETATVTDAVIGIKSVTTCELK